MKIETTSFTGAVINLTLSENEIDTLYSITQCTDEIIKCLDTHTLYDGDNFTSDKVEAMLVSINKAITDML